MSEKTTNKPQRFIEAAEHESEAKRLRKAEKDFWNEVEERLAEVKERFSLVEKEKRNDFSRGAGVSPARFLCI